MNLDKTAIEAAIKDKIIEIAASLGCDARELQPDEIVPATGLIDSAGLLDLIAWYEAYYDIRVTSEEFTIDNLGTLSAMADFVRRRKGIA